ncbi:hypothetical protein BKA82DRAFT_4100466 [Pisolithus tinctorius]|nr:hypothetical protein BKA82DRAFT_4100466 [Pisolithus tinctorius]
MLYLGRVLYCIVCLASFNADIESYLVGMVNGRGWKGRQYRRDVSRSQMLPRGAWDPSALVFEDPQRWTLGAS